MTINYKRILIALLCGALVLPSLAFQFLMYGLTISGGYAPIWTALALGAMLGGPTIFVIFLLGLLGGLRLALHMAGWSLVAHLAFYAHRIASYGRLPASASDIPVLGQHPTAASACFLLTAIGLAVVLLRAGAPKRTPRSTITPLA